MIQDLDETIKELLVQKVPINTSAIDIKFDMPTKEWSTTITKPTINLFLYDLRENVELRSNERYWTRTGNPPTSATESRAPVRLDLSYLISVWTTEISDEHRLLGRLLATLFRFHVLPTDVLQGSMQAQPLPLLACVAQPERTPNSWDVWAEFDHRLKAALSYVVTLSVDPYAPEVYDHLVQTRQTTLTLLGTPNDH
ncbi:MAG TPA: DUF4255 domain-containing protein [Polyangiaceae bacterium]